MRETKVQQARRSLRLIYALGEGQSIAVTILRRRISIMDSGKPCVSSLRRSLRTILRSEETCVIAQFLVGLSQWVGQNVLAGYADVGLPNELMLDASGSRIYNTRGKRTSRSLIEILRK